ncbi:MAG: hypothetical protein WC473_05350 [Patescibacteria group bacterium]|jgi:hypothetical protein
MQIGDYVVLAAFVMLCYISAFPLHLLYALALACWSYLRLKGNRWIGQKNRQQKPAPADKNLIYLICPVRNITPEQQEVIDDYVRKLEEKGLRVHFPPRDVDQNDPTGINICLAHAEAMKACSYVHIFWDAGSTGSHFDLGMAFMARKPVYLVELFTHDNEGKSYAKVIREMEGWGNEPIL